MTDSHPGVAPIPKMMNAVRLHQPGGPAGLIYEQVAVPQAQAGEALIRVHAAAITRDELDWPVNRLPAIPSYEFSGVVAALGPGGGGLTVGEAVYALSAFDRDGAAAEYMVVAQEFLAPKPKILSTIQTAGMPPGPRGPSQEQASARGIKAIYFVVEPNGQQLVELAQLADQGKLWSSVAEVFPLASAREAFERSLSAHAAGKIVLHIADE